jgi:hypothetical protein
MRQEMATRLAIFIGLLIIFASLIFAFLQSV